MFELPPVVDTQVVIESAYVRDGLTIADDAALGGKVRLDAGVVYVEAGATVADFYNGANTELAAKVGAKFDVATVNLDASVTYLNYRGAVAGLDNEEVVYDVVASKKIGEVTAHVRGQYNPDALLNGEEYTAAAGLAFPVGWSTTLSGEYGRVYGDREYSIWNVGATKAITDTVALDVRYIDNGVDRRFEGADLGDAFVVSLKTSF